MHSSEYGIKTAEKHYSSVKQYTEENDSEMKSSTDDFIQGFYTTSRPWSYFSRGDSWIPPFTPPFHSNLFPTEKVGLGFYIVLKRLSEMFLKFLLKSK